MTAEIAVLNREAVAIAADSAVTTTMGPQGEHKIFTTANKIFALSKFNPVGIMVYANAEFMDVPWETIIKIYRNRLGETNFDTLDEYAEDFVNFFNKENHLFPAEVQDQRVKHSIYSYLAFLKRRIKEKVEQGFYQKGRIDENEVSMIVSSTIKNAHKVWEGADKLAAADSIESIIKEEYSGEIERIIQEIFQGGH